MKRPFILLLALLCVTALIGANDADARRIGGGRSFGAQRSVTPTPAPSVTSPGAASNPVMPAPSGVTPARPVTPAATPALGGASRWLGPIAGIAAGLGLAALFSHFGLSESFGSLLLVALLVGAGVFILRAFLARRSAPVAAGLAPRPDAFATRTEPTAQRVEPVASRFEPAWGGSTPASAAAASRFPPGFEPAPFLAEAKRQFHRLQEAYDRGDRALLAEVMTPEMLAEIGRDMVERGTHVATEVVSLDGEVLDVATEDGQHWASVRFHGLTREDGRATPEPFDEVWNLAKPVDDSAGWRLAGIQQTEQQTEQQTAPA